jgi:hypothetical protein
MLNHQPAKKQSNPQEQRYVYCCVMYLLITLTVQEIHQEGDDTSFRPERYLVMLYIIDGVTYFVNII